MNLRGAADTSDREFEDESCIGKGRSAKIVAVDIASRSFPRMSGSQQLSCFCYPYNRCGRFGETLNPIFWHTVAYDVEQEKDAKLCYEPVHFQHRCRQAAPMGEFWMPRDGQFSDGGVVQNTTTYLGIPIPSAISFTGAPFTLVSTKSLHHTLVFLHPSLWPSAHRASTWSIQGLDPQASGLRPQILTYYTRLDLVQSGD
ncbi:hypothetical protein ARMSODRAFT_983858 [Armillaria solidipes]|uniref:Uncharacterized protein n=1 Tax=Armillaria solidipes TaxID=1076256 RepID=A0A2H3AHL1_9AGAR|nr:hypothetical protein ARMSODRAFT_983858 [Armillaria solidipes]